MDRLKDVSGRQTTYGRLPRLARGVFVGLVWNFRLNNPAFLLFLHPAFQFFKTVEGDADLRLGGFARSGIGREEDGHKLFAVRSHVIGPRPNHEYPFNEGSRITKCKAGLSADVDGNQTI